MSRQYPWKKTLIENKTISEFNVDWDEGRIQNIIRTTLKPPESLHTTRKTLRKEIIVTSKTN